MEKKLCHFTIADGTSEEVRQLGKALKTMKDNGLLPQNLEFMITNDRVQLQYIKYVIKELIKLYKMTKKNIDEKLDTIKKQKKTNGETDGS